MTKAQIRTAVRNLMKEQSTDAGALLGSGNTMIDDFIDDAAGLVLLDLIKQLPTRFTSTESISLEAGTANYDLTATWMTILDILKTVTGQRPRPIPYVEIQEKADIEILHGHTAADPKGFTLIGKTIYFYPTPSEDKDDYCTALFHVAETEPLPDAGPTYIPAIAHRCIVYKACDLAAVMSDAKTSPFEKLYERRIVKCIEILGAQVHQPRFLGGSFMDRIVGDARDPAFFDLTGIIDD